MVKRKPKAKVKTNEVSVPIRQTACNSDCWLCWLFKLMIVLFVAMIVFWLGFCFGILSYQGPMAKGDYGYKKMSVNKTSGFCSGVMESAMSSMTMSLMNKTGDAFDREFLLQMTLHHEGALEMAKLALAQSQREEVKEFAQSIIDAQGKEIDQMKAWQAAWFAVNNNQ
jgi:amino acid transporter